MHSSMCWSMIFIVLSSVLTRTAQASGSGRVFPIDSENFAIENFQNINPKLEWDPTNFLIDLSGQYANCKYVNQKERLTADRTTPEGGPVFVYIDTTPGTASDVNSVNVYISTVINRWMADKSYHPQIFESQRVGCSVRPGCSSNVVVACVFSSVGLAKTDPKTDAIAPTRAPTKRPPVTPERILENTTNRMLPPQTNKPSFIPDAPDTPPTYKQAALAFTPDQYSVAEKTMHKKWDRSHYLENLSGFETDCAMVGTASWRFKKIEEIKRVEGLKLSGQYGYHSNDGSTPAALEQILAKFKPVTTAKAIGCSIIPDCKAPGGKMNVVVACLYEEE